MLDVEPDVVVTEVDSKSIEPDAVVFEVVPPPVMISAFLTSTIAAFRLFNVLFLIGLFVL